MVLKHLLLAWFDLQSLYPCNWFVAKYAYCDNNFFFLNISAENDFAYLWFNFIVDQMKRTSIVE